MIHNDTLLSCDYHLPANLLIYIYLRTYLHMCPPTSLHNYIFTYLPNYRPTYKTSYLPNYLSLHRGPRTLQQVLSEDQENGFSNPGHHSLMPWQAAGWQSIKHSMEQEHREHRICILLVIWANIDIDMVTNTNLYKYKYWPPCIDNDERIKKK